MKHPFFLSFAPDDIEALSRLGRQVRFAAGESILAQRDPADGFYLIDNGEVSLEFGLPGQKKVPVQKIGEGELLGLSWLFEPYRWEFSAVALTDVTATFFAAAEIRKACDANPKLGYQLMEQLARVLTKRLQATRHRLRVFVERASAEDEDRQVC